MLPVVFSGIQPSGVQQLGNYLGAIRSWARLSTSKEYNSIFSVVDLHALTVRKSAKELRLYRRQTVAGILAAGVNHETSIVMEQSRVPEHSELMWILNCFVGMGRLNRMTQWKSKLNLSRETSIMDSHVLEKLKLGLFSYPVLMAADILLYQTKYVPVGEDQFQHIELTRDVRDAFHHETNTKVFTYPQIIKNENSRVMSLRDPLKKMSKSDGPDSPSSIFISDDAKVIRQKISKAVTDSIQGPLTYEPETRPGVANLIRILCGFLDKSPQDIASEYSYMNHAQFKNLVADSIIVGLSPVRQEFLRLTQDPAFLERILSDGSSRARELAKPTMEKVKEAVGLL